MLLCRVDAEIELRSIDRQDLTALEALEPGDLTFAQGEWLFAPGAAATWLSNALREMDEGNSLESGIFVDSVLVGLVALHDINRENHSAKIDFVMDARHRNRGTMTRACEALLDYSFVTLGICRFQIYCDAANLPALRVPGKLGFTRECLLRAFYHTNSGPRDVVLYSVDRTEPEASRFETRGAASGLDNTRITSRRRNGPP